MFGSLSKARKIKRDIVAQEPAEEWKLLSAWQIERLKTTHKDLLENPRYRPAVNFFMTDIYAARDFSQRDHDVERIFPLMRTILPQGAVHSLEDAMKLNVLTRELDQELASIIFQKLGARIEDGKDGISAEMYQQAYNISGRVEARREQIESIAELGAKLDSVVKMPGIVTTLKLARMPARLAGFHELQDFLERGIQAFQAMGGAGIFLEKIKRREMKILEKIHQQRPTSEWYGVESLHYDEA